MKATPYGERGIFIDLEIDDAPDRAQRTHAAARDLAARFADAEVIVGAGSIAVQSVDPSSALSLVGDLEAPRPAEGGESVQRHVVGVVYDGPDLEEVAARASLTRDEVIERHLSRDYIVELCGFMPGFAYLGPLDPRLVLPRRASPRPRIPAASVAIAGAFTGIYPLASPGGWNLLGRAASTSLFVPSREPPHLFAPGDLVRFESITPSNAEPASARAAPLVATTGGIVIDVAGPGITVQDGGRPGQLARGLPPSGPLDQAAHAAANRAVGNAEGAAAIEIPLGRLSIDLRQCAVLSVDGEPPRRLEPGHRFEVEPGGRAVRYLAVAGGVDVPSVLGSRATLLAAEIGGLYGRTLRRGDVLAIGREHHARSAERVANAPGSIVHVAAGDMDRIADAPSPAILDVDPGPHAARLGSAALEALISGAWRISNLGNRVGVRLEGDRIPRQGGDLGLPVPMIRGAIQITTDGTPIILGPDHPTTGGYPVLAVVRSASQPVLARVRPRGEVRFRLG